MALDTYIRNLVSNEQVDVNELADHDVKEFICRLMTTNKHDALTVYESVNMDNFTNALIRSLIAPSIDNKLILADQLMDDAFLYYKDEMQQMLDDEVSRIAEVDSSDFQKRVDKTNGEISWIKK